MSSDSSRKSPDFLTPLDPRVKLFAILAMSLLAILGDSLAYLFTLAVFSFGLIVISPLRRDGVLRIVLGLSVFLVWGTALGQGFFYQELPRRPLIEFIPPFRVGRWEFEGLILYRDGLYYGLMQSLRLLSIAWTGAALCRATPATQIIAVMRWLRLPYALSFMVMTALRFLPQLFGEIRQARLAMRLKGQQFNLAHPVRSVLGEFKLLRPIFASLVRRSHTMGLALAARGYHVGAAHPATPIRSIRAGEWAMLGGISGILILVGAARWFYLMYVNGLYYSPSLRPLYAFVRQWL